MLKVPLRTSRRLVTGHFTSLSNTILNTTDSEGPTQVTSHLVIQQISHRLNTRRTIHSQVKHRRHPILNRNASLLPIQRVHSVKGVLNRVTALYRHRSLRSPARTRRQLTNFPGHTMRNRFRLIARIPQPVINQIQVLPMRNHQGVQSANRSRNVSSTNRHSYYFLLEQRRRQGPPKASRHLKVPNIRRHNVNIPNSPAHKFRVHNRTSREARKSVVTRTPLSSPIQSQLGRPLFRQSY